MITQSQLAWARLPWLVFVVLILLGCASSGTHLGDSSQDGQLLLSQLPALPMDDAPGRVAAETSVVNKNGSDTWLASVGAKPGVTDLVITSMGNTYEYAIYSYETGLTETSTYEAGISFSLTPGNQAWVAISDYGHHRWAISGPYTNSMQIPLDTGVYLSPAGNFYMAVIAYGGSAVTVISSSFSFDNGVAPPETTYLADIKALLDSNCISCHKASSPAAGVALDSYRGARSNSTIVIAKAITGAHGGLNLAEKDMYQAWVDANTPYGADVTYTLDILPIVQLSCAPCHTSGSSGGVNLGSYSNASLNAANALTQILSENMPQSGGPLSNDEKDLWQVWVDDGTPE
jgi:mono/diheme cytochrome c family protein